ncbi:hypothetical protein N658DRAFT_274749 [Parathielavia hyrcaniae]|uniref:Uncharacterized protein n=1 Tax=Parathielavia hyrcaniae TaxID=113614 RepID=A0AAN6Q4J9_9PEZI|nr:hypothetical protein N658DRAFT_274749 [Parathielavia hyrcaniae]
MCLLHLGREQVGEPTSMFCMALFGVGLLLVACYTAWVEACGAAVPLGGRRINSTQYEAGGLISARSRRGMDDFMATHLAWLRGAAGKQRWKVAWNTITSMYRAAGLSGRRVDSGWPPCAALGPSKSQVLDCHSMAVVSCCCAPRERADSQSVSGDCERAVLVWRTRGRIVPLLLRNPLTNPCAAIWL